MHVHHWIAVKAESSQDASNSAEDFLNELLGSEFYDWFLVGGGRWNPNFETNEFGDDDYDRAVSYEADPEKFREIIDQSRRQKKEDVKSMVEDFIKKRKKVENDEPYDFYKDVEEWLNAEDESEARIQFNIKRSAVRQVLSIMSGHWVPESFFFDKENGSTTPRYLFEAIDKGETGWWLVPIDFHY